MRDRDVRILLLAQFYPQFYPPIVGGEERHVRSLATSLSRRGHTVSVATLWVPGTFDIETTDDFTVNVKGSLQRLRRLFTENERRHTPPFPVPETVAGLRRIVAKFKPDVVHARNWLVNSFLPLKSWSGAPLILTLHDYGLICPKRSLTHGSAENTEVCDGPHLRKCWPCAADHHGNIKGVVTALGTFGYFYNRARNDCRQSFSGQVNQLAEFGVDYAVIPNFVPDDVAVLSPDVEPRVAESPDEYILFVGDLIRLKGAPVLLDAYAGSEGCTRRPVLIGRDSADMLETLPPNVINLVYCRIRRSCMHWHGCLFGVGPSMDVMHVQRW
jgi:glycosyltransferase involved in cell wall biosynthesis